MGWDYYWTGTELGLGLLLGLDCYWDWDCYWDCCWDWDCYWDWGYYSDWVCCWDGTGIWTAIGTGTAIGTVCGRRMLARPTGRAYTPNCIRNAIIISDDKTSSRIAEANIWLH